MQEFLGTFKKYAVFEGRASRREFWVFFVGLFVLAIIVSVLEVVLGLRGDSMSMTGPLSLIFSLGILLPYIGVSIRRFHDQGKSGWFFLLNLIPLIGWLVFLIAVSGKATQGPNKYGPPVVGPAASGPPSQGIPPQDAPPQA